MVNFNLANNTVHYTYSRKDYDRSSEKRTLYFRRIYNMISPNEWNQLFIDLNLFKLYEMDVHPESRHYIKFHYTELI